jgi:Fic-DOC domain mobile mystery protein B
MSVRFEYPEGATPLSPDETESLIPKHISTQKELNEAEQANILEARKWLTGKKPKDLLTEPFVRKLHKQMFSDVWKWAGTYRQTETKIGIDPLQVPTQIAELCKNTAYWIENKSFGWDELAARFHHRLVWIHAFPNGNGRHAREMADLLLFTHGQKTFSWGDAERGLGIGQTGDCRVTYIEALRAADQNRFAKLLQFVRS